MQWMIAVKLQQLTMLLQIAKPKPVKRTKVEEESYREGTLFFEYEDDEESVNELDTETPSAFMLKMQQEMKKPPTPLPVVSSRGRTFLLLLSNFFFFSLNLLVVVNANFSIWTSQRQSYPSMYHKDSLTPPVVTLCIYVLFRVARFFLFIQHVTLVIFIE